LKKIQSRQLKFKIGTTTTNFIGPHVILIFFPNLYIKTERSTSRLLKQIGMDSSYCWSEQVRYILTSQWAGYEKGPTVEGAEATSKGNLLQTTSCDEIY
jgi:hypothetical protein